MMPISRRSFLTTSAVVLAPAAARADIIHSGYPTQEPELVQEMVIVAHANFARVKELVGRQPALAKAAWDWGFGDWEDALGAASHVGSRDIAELLIANGARPTIFSAAMLGQLDVVKAFIAAAPGVQRTKGPHSITLLSHARAGGARAQAVADYLNEVGGADEKPAVQPLSSADIARLTGAYTFGLTPADRVEITATKDQLSIGRPGKFPRGLTHLGSFEFHPVGAETVRIRFAESAGAMLLTVHDPDVVLTARKPR
jgi:hypothetical protein